MCRADCWFSMYNELTSALVSATLVIMYNLKFSGAQNPQVLTIGFKGLKLKIDNCLHQRKPTFIFPRNRLRLESFENICVCLEQI